MTIEDLEILEAPRPVVDSVADILPTFEDYAPPSVADTPAQKVAASTNQPAAQPITEAQAFSTSKLYTNILSTLLGIIGDIIAPTTNPAEYRLNESEKTDFSKAMSDMLVHNGASAPDPNILFMMVATVTILPKVKNIYNNRKELKAAKDRQAISTKKNAPNLPPPVAGQAVGDKAKPQNEAGEGVNFDKPASKEEAMKILEISLGRPNFKPAEKAAGYYCFDINNTRIKNGQHETTTAAKMSPYFRDFFIQCEKNKMSQDDAARLAKKLQKEITSLFKISSADITAARAKKI
jgi:hypothetical protein